MFDMARFVQVKALLEAVEAVAGALTPNERELFLHLKAKYAEPGASAPDDLTCLEVMRRNVEIRKGYDVDPSHSRVIEAERAPQAEKD